MTTETPQHRTDTQPLIGTPMTPRERQLSAAIDLLRVMFDEATTARDFQRLDVIDGALDQLELLAFWAPGQSS